MYNRIVLNIGVVAVSGITVRFQLLDGGIKPRPATFPPLKKQAHHLCLWRYARGLMLEFNCMLEAS